MSARLPYEPIGGNLSEADTFAQLTEYLRLAAECCYTLGHHRKANDDKLTGQGFLAIGQMLEKTRENVTTLATGSTRLLRQ